MAIRLRPEAEADVASAYRSYEEKLVGLGTDFLAAVEAALVRIEQNPRQFPVVHEEIRRVLTKRFPFAVFFILSDDTAVVLAVLPQAADPTRWKRRGE